jgi:uncharacterized repeat protein (TIGR03803 family)
MQGKKLFVPMIPVLAMFAVTALMTGTPAAAQTETVLYNFTCCPLGPANQPYAGLISDRAGNLFGTTFQGGAYGHGAVFELSPMAGGGWSEAVIYSFNEQPGRINYGPESGLILDAAGNLYGTKSTGGTSGFGIVFELSRGAGGKWTLKVLHSFTGKDGDYPEAGVIFDSAGNLYGTTHFGGAYGYGAVFELSPIAGGGWTEMVLHSFPHNKLDGISPDGGLVFDAAGNLYGTTRLGGTNFSKKCQSGCGTVFELSPVTGKGWTETVLHSFDENGTDGAFAYGGLIIDGAGNLYGATNAGGTGLCKTSVVVGCGTVFELSPVAGGGWTEAILYNFVKNGTDGVYPQTGTLLLVGGNLYGTTGKGGNNSVGTVYKLSPAVSGGWTETILHAFQNNGSDGLYPNGSLIIDSLGNLYGTTSSGGTSVQGGTVFEITP